VLALLRVRRRGADAADATAAKKQAPLHAHRLRRPHTEYGHRAGRLCAAALRCVCVRVCRCVLEVLIVAMDMMSAVGAVCGLVMRWLEDMLDEKKKENDDRLRVLNDRLVIMNEERNMR
jgi:hypothetical protein